MNNALKETTFEKFHVELINSEDYHLIPSNIRYQAIYFQESYKDCSFPVLLNGKEGLLILCSKKDSTLSWFGNEIKFVFKNDLSATDKFQLIKKAALELSKIIDEFGITKIIVGVDFCIERLINFKFEKMEALTRDFILTGLDYSENKSMLRKSYKSLINWGEKNLNTTILTSKNISDDIFESFRLFHISVAGRETRSENTWRAQLKAIKLDEAFLVCCYYQHQLASAQFISYGKHVAYYGVGVMDRNLMAMNIPLGHWPLISAVKHLGEIGISKLFLSDTILSRQLSEKEETIIKFKKGFTKMLDYKTVITLKKSETL